ncbi:MAG: hypothetical protein GF419_02175 [Ignavibacteriales bacterium]|nr:hypothetical protein [Ignavibacteriales bacterium]
MKRFANPSRLGLAIIIVGLLSVQGCDLYETIVNLTRLQFSLDDVDNLNVAGVTLDDKNDISDVTTSEVFTLTSALLSGALTTSMTLNVEALNPNDGSGGYQRTKALIKAFPYNLQLQEKRVVSGDIEEPISVPGTGEVEIFKLGVEFDLLEIFSFVGYEDALNMTLQLNASDNDATTLALQALPVVGTEYGDIEYPDTLTIEQTIFTD